MTAVVVTGMSRVGVRVMATTTPVDSESDPACVKPYKNTM